MEFYESFVRGVKVSSTWQMIDNGEQIGITLQANDGDAKTNRLRDRKYTSAVVGYYVDSLHDYARVCMRIRGVTASRNLTGFL